MTREQIEDILLDEIGPEYRTEINRAVSSLAAEIEGWPDELALELARKMVGATIEE